MSRRPLLERALVFVLIPFWVLAVALHLDLAFRGELAWVPLYVEPAASAQDSPHVTGFWPETPADPDGLRVGDALVSVGGRSLLGASRLGVLRAVYGTRMEAGAAHFEVEREGAVRPARLDLLAFNAPWSQAPLVIGLGVGALVIWVRRASLRAARSCALAMTAYSLHWAIFIPSGGWRTTLGFWLLVGAGSLFGALGLRAVLLFPERGKPLPRRVRALPWAFVAMGPLFASWLVGFPLSGRLGLELVLAANLMLILSLLVAITLAYRRSDVITRRQLRWAVLGFYVGLAPIAFAAALGAWMPSLRPVYEWSLLATLAIPLSLTIALCRHNLFDIDRLISTAGAQSLVLIMVIALVLAPLPAASEVVSRLVDVQPAVAQGLFALLLATGLTVGQRFVRPHVEHVLFRERHTFELGLRDLRTSLGQFDSLSSLVDAVAEGLTTLLDLRTCALYIRTGESFSVVSSRGAGIPPSFPVASALPAMIEETDGPVDDARWRRWAARKLIGEQDRAGLESLDVRLLVPVAGEDGLTGFVCLGPKGNEDVYTPVDGALLEALGDRISAELRRFDAEAVLRAEREQLERLSGYVPEPVRDSLLARPIEVEPGEREVSVLFVDIRGYVQLAESRSADEIFRIINTYTMAVSRIVREHGGFVVEFQGDGLMAVFGAPQALDHKEQAAVSCSLDILSQLGARGLDELPDLPLSIGVGVATGMAYVGNIQSIDRKIWSVIGNTTNLAARLQALTRELDCGVVIDDRTFTRAEPPAGVFHTLDEMHIRGLSEPMKIQIASLADVSDRAAG